MPTMLLYQVYRSVAAALIILLEVAQGQTHDPLRFTHTDGISSVSSSAHHPSSGRKLGRRTDIATEVLNVVVDKVVGDMIEKEEIRRVYYRRAMQQLERTKCAVVECVRINEEDSELEMMKRQKDEKAGQ